MTGGGTFFFPDAEITRTLGRRGAARAPAHMISDPTSLETLDAVIRGAPHIVVVVDPSFVVVAANDALHTATGVVRDALIGRDLFDVFPDNPADPTSNGAAALRASFERVLATRTADLMGTQRYDVRAPAGAYETRFWRRVNYPILGPDGGVRYIVHQSEEITELVELRRRAIDQADALHHEATEILESITDAFFALDTQWRFTYLNRQAQLVLGCTRAELLGSVIWQRYRGLAGSDFEVVYRRAMDERLASSVTAYYPDHDRWYEVHAYPGREGIAVYFRNVTEKRTIEAERERLIAESERLRRIYEAALSNTPDLVYIFDLEHRFIYANEALLGMWGRTRENALGKNCLELGYEPWHAAMHDREIEQVIATRKGIRGEVPFTGTNGRRIYDYIFVPVLDARGEVVAVAGTTRDVTERQQAEQAMREQAERLLELDRAKDEFLATLAHELRNPLAPIVNSIEIMKRVPGDGELAGRVRDTIERQVKVLVRLVDDLLDVSRITRGKLELRRGRVELASIVAQAVEASRPHLDAGRHEFSIVTPPYPMHVEGDAVRLVQVLSNVLINAAKYTPSGGCIGMRVEHAGALARIAVEDSGIGIAPEMIPRIFEMFTRADHSAERMHDGLGIGLTLARQLLELHGGTICASSAGLGKGARFTIALPLADASDAVHAGSDPSRRSQGG